jgi:glutamate-1-semialdehyde 2,1-aminomutase
MAMMERRMPRRRPRSAHEAALLERAARYAPATVRSPTTSSEQALVVRAARGARLVDWSGNEYIDYLLGSGPMLLGHAHPSVVAAVRAQLEHGSAYLLTSEPAIVLAEEIVKTVPCAEMVSFNGTGSESTFFAMRLARAYRRRDRILKFEGAFHGMSDYALMTTQWTAVPRDYPQPVPNSAGIPRSVEAEVLVAPFNDIATTAAIIEAHHDELAAVIVEPMQRTIPPRPGFLGGLREVTKRFGIPLIFDEVVTGFRLALGGAQEYYGVVPDLCALGKSISGGYPISVLCGRAEIMELLKPAPLVEPGGREAGGSVAQTGTFSGNPISAVAALATLAELRKEGVYDRLFATGRRLMTSLQELLDDAGIPARVTGEPPAFEVWFTDHDITDFRSTLGADRAAHARFTALLLERGILKAHEKFFVSTVHDDEDVRLTLAAFASAVDELRDWRGG